jgi:hypothetical protein
VIHILSHTGPNRQKYTIGKQTNLSKKEKEITNGGEKLITRE